MEEKISQFKIVSDSSSDVARLDGEVAYAYAPLKIITTEKEYVDDDYLDVKGMVDDLDSYKGRSSTSCPNSEEWIEAFGDKKYIFCVTITGTLSGSYNAACVAKAAYEEKYPDRKVYVINSLSTGPEMALIIDKLRDLILEGKEYEEIVEEIQSYTKKTGLLFMLESMKNLANNGRVNPLVAKAAGLLGIRVIGKASDRGDLQQLNKCRGEKKALETIVERLKELAGKVSKVKIAHCFNEEAAQKLKELIVTNFDKVKVEVSKCKALCSFYAEKGGLLVGFEKATIK